MPNMGQTPKHRCALERKVKKNSAGTAKAPALIGKNRNMMTPLAHNTASKVGGLAAAPGAPFCVRSNCILSAAIEFIEKMLAAPSALPAERTSLMKVLASLRRAPLPPPDVFVVATLMRAPFWCEFDSAPCRVSRWWEVGVEECQISIVSGGVLTIPQIGSDSFECMRWDWTPGQDEAVYLMESHRSIRLNPAVRPFEQEIGNLAVTAADFVIDISDAENRGLPESKRPHWQR